MGDGVPAAVVVIWPEGVVRRLFLEEAVPVLVLVPADGDCFGGARLCPTDGGAPRGEAIGEMPFEGEREMLLDCVRAWATVEEYAAEKDLEAIGGCGLAAAFML